GHEPLVAGCLGGLQGLPGKDERIREPIATPVALLPIEQRERRPPHVARRLPQGLVDQVDLVLAATRVVTDDVGEKQQELGSERARGDGGDAVVEETPRAVPLARRRQGRRRFHHQLRASNRRLVRRQSVEGATEELRGDAGRTSLERVSRCLRELCRDLPVRLWAGEGEVPGTGLRVWSDLRDPRVPALALLRCRRVVRSRGEQR